MSKAIITESSLTDIANAIRDMKGTESEYRPSEMSQAIRSVKSGILYAQETTASILLANGCYYYPNQSNYYKGYLLEDSTNALSVDFHNATKWRVIVKFMLTGIKTGSSMWTRTIVANTSIDYEKGVAIEVDKNLFVAGGYGTTSSHTTDAWCFFDASDIIVQNTWFYVCASYDATATKLTVTLYDADGTVLRTNTITVNNILNTSFTPQIAGLNATYFTFAQGAIDLNEIVYEADNVLLWGKTNSKTKNMGWEASE